MSTSQIAPSMEVERDSYGLVGVDLPRVIENRPLCLGRSDRDVLRAIRLFQFELGADTPLSGVRIAQRADVSINTFYRCVARLMQNGFLQREEGHGWVPCVYQVLVQRQVAE